ncbi:hypothetical protein Xen7305DRAFT_00020020 [Xenococcus sp. PCC 7305]|uniref:hypothetical protein n=1 Tax=Xenococcus sp. PCC 7305 TaxID=102125 RepID=UPI0002ABDA63|nr:hypothetical protein [Xenococcus sp. PCC 7305]ELS02289.1 hypothetical protein Xen7305DRAFT_00020020 [Xenococcus sp. PCC 7305]
MNLPQNPPTPSDNQELSPRPSIPVPPTPAITTPVTSEAEESTDKRTQPIPPPSHPRQYRAIGLIKGKYQPTDEDQITQGNLTTSEGIAIDAVLLGRTISLVKKHLDLTEEHLWVVYPRTKVDSDHLHVQIVGVWEPETLDKDQDESLASSEEVEAGYFSIRGEVIFFSEDEEVIIVKIKQFPRKEGEKPKFFKLKLKGVMDKKPLKRFWDFDVHLEGETLVIKEGTDLGFAQKKPKFKKKFSKKPITKKAPVGKPNVSSAATSRPKPRIKKPSS